MREKLLREQESRIEQFFLKESREQAFESAWKYVIDSVIDNKFRLLISKSKKPIRRGAEISELAKFDLWEEYTTEIVETKKAYQKIGVRKNEIKEGNVFVSFGGKTFEITEFVRQEVKDQYRPLLEREYTTLKEKGRALI